MDVLEACTNYQAADFEATCHFFGDVLGLQRVISWDRVDGRGAYFGSNGTMVVEITGVPRGSAEPPRPGTDLAVTIMVSDVEKALAEIEERGGSVDLSIVEHAWGRYFGIRDPNGVRVWIMERLGPMADEAHRFRDLASATGRATPSRRTRS